MKYLAILLVGVLPMAAAISGRVRIDSGEVSGVPTSTPGIYVFRGIPYAAPPVGNLRWHAPQPAARWTGVRKMDQFQSRCVQPLRTNPREAQGSEDCLYLNVWTPAKSASDKLPVMLWIHGGGFRDGTGAMLLHDGEQLARKGVVLVTINYRLGVLGFLAHPELTTESDRHASGNYGLMDAIASLEWVERNIARFGGDPAKVTIFGQSAGSMAVNCLQASPLAKGLFRAVIGESGASFNGMLNNGALAEAEAMGVKFAASVGATSLADLRARPAAELTTAGFSAGPNTDGYVLPEAPLALFQEGKANLVPALIGSNSDEGRLFARGRMSAHEFVEQAHRRFGAAAGEYLKLYPADSDAQAMESRQRSGTEENMGLNVRLWAEAQAKAGVRAYVYYFTRVTPGGAPVNTAPDVPRLGAPHGEELAYVSNSIGNAEALRNSDTFRNAQPDAYDLKLADMVSSYWVNFARTLDPNGGSLPRWPAFDPAHSDLVMELGDKVGMRAHPDNAGIVFLEKHPFQPEPPPAAGASTGPQPINPGEVWPDDRGKHIQAHGGGIVKLGDTYYWFGEERGHGLDPAKRYVSCYSSTDLAHWKFRNQVIQLADPENFGPRWVLERPKVYFNARTKKFVMYMHIDGNTPEGSYKIARVGVATSDTVDGDYQYLKSFRPLGHESRDIGQFIDDDGAAYLIFEDRPFGFRIARLSDDYLNVEKEMCLIPMHMEGGAVVHLDGLYYAIGSALTGWAPNPNKYATAKSLEGPWSEFKDIAPPETKTYGSQSTMLLKVVGARTTTVIFMGDIWKPRTQWDSRYLWMPLEIGGGKLWLPEPKPWTLDIATGEAVIGK